MTMLDFEPLTVAVPLREEPPGVFRVGKSRVLLHLVLRSYGAGAPPEPIPNPSPPPHLPVFYGVVSRYRAPPAPFEAYLQQCEAAAAKPRRRIEESQGSQDNLRAILLARAKAKEEARAQADKR